MWRMENPSGSLTSITKKYLLKIFLVGCTLFTKRKIFKMTKIFTKHISSSNSKDFIETTKVLTGDKQLLSIKKYVIIKIFYKVYQVYTKSCNWVEANINPILEFQLWLSLSILSFSQAIFNCILSNKTFPW